MPQENFSLSAASSLTRTQEVKTGSEVALTADARGKGSKNEKRGAHELRLPTVFPAECPQEGFCPTVPERREEPP